MSIRQKDKKQDKSKKTKKIQNGKRQKVVTMKYSDSIEISHQFYHNEILGFRCSICIS